MFVFIAKSLFKILSNIQRCTFVAYQEEIKSVFSTLAKTSKGYLHERQDETIFIALLHAVRSWKGMRTGWDNFYPAFMEKNQTGQFLAT